MCDRRRREIDRECGYVTGESERERAREREHVDGCRWVCVGMYIYILYILYIYI